MNFKKLLFVTDFEQLQYDALLSLLELRKAALDHVVFLNVIQREKVALRRGAGYRKDEEIRLRERANIRFIEWAENLFEQGMEVGVYITVGSLVQQVITAAAKEQVDLIVIGPQKKGKLEQFYSGSDITEIIRRAAIPVLVYRYLSPEGSGTEMPFKRPVLATDGSAASQRALAYLEALKGVVQQVDLVYVADDKALKGDSAMAVQKTRKESRKRLDALCDRLEGFGIPARPHVYVGEAFTEIERAARECQGTLILVGTSGKHYWVERWVGSTPRMLAEKSAFPILLIPPNME